MFTPGDHQYRIDEQRRSQRRHEADVERMLPKAAPVRRSLYPWLSRAALSLVPLAKRLLRRRPVPSVRPRVQ